MSNELEKSIKDELKEVAKKILIESVNINIVYRAFTNIEEIERI